MKSITMSDKVCTLTTPISISQSVENLALAHMIEKGMKVDGLK